MAEETAPSPPHGFVHGFLMGFFSLANGAFKWLVVEEELLQILHFLLHKFHCASKAHPFQLGIENKANLLSHTRSCFYSVS